MICVADMPVQILLALGIEKAIALVSFYSDGCPIPFLVAHDDHRQNNLRVNTMNRDHHDWSNLNRDGRWPRLDYFDALQANAC